MKLPTLKDENRSAVHHIGGELLGQALLLLDSIAAHHGDSHLCLLPVVIKALIPLELVTELVGQVKAKGSPGGQVEPGHEKANTNGKEADTKDDAEGGDRDGPKGDFLDAFGDVFGAGPGKDCGRDGDGEEDTSQDEEQTGELALVHAVFGHNWIVGVFFVTAAKGEGRLKRGKERVNQGEKMRRKVKRN
jgi:hypothetical protein